MGAFKQRFWASIFISVGIRPAMDFLKSYAFVIFLSALFVVNGMHSNDGGGEGVHVENVKRAESEVNSENPPEVEKEERYNIEIGVRFSDGGEVLMIHGFERDAHNILKMDDTPKIEKVLKLANGIDGEFIENKESWIKGLYPNIEDGAKIRYKASIHKAKIIKNGDEVEEVPGVDFRKNEGDEEHVYSLVKHLNSFDRRWFLPGNEFEPFTTFEALFDGHTMVALSDDSGHEVARFHFNRYGLNLYKKNEKYLDEKEQKEKGRSYIVQNDAEFTEVPMVVEEKHERGTYVKRPFDMGHGRGLKTRPLTLRKLKELGHKAIGGRKQGAVNSGDGFQFKCLHFVYAFVEAIVEEQDAKLLRENFEHWPEPQRQLDELIKKLDGTFAFEHIFPKKEKELQTVDELDLEGVNIHKNQNPRKTQKEATHGEDAARKR